MLLTIFNENYAFVDPEEKKIKMFVDNKVSVMQVPEGMNVTALRITEDTLSFFLDENTYVRGNLRQNADRAMYKSVDNLPEGKIWSSILYVSKERMKRIFLVCKDKETNQIESYVEDENGEWIDMSPNEKNIVESLPEMDPEGSSNFFVNRPEQRYYGVFLDSTKEVFHQKISLPFKSKFHDMSLEKKSIAYLDNQTDDEKPRMTLYKSDIQKLLKGEEDATKVLMNDVVIPRLYLHEDHVILLTFANMIVIVSDDEFYGTGLEKLNLEDDILINMEGHKNRLICSSYKGRIFLFTLSEDLKSFSSTKEVKHKNWGKIKEA